MKSIPDFDAEDIYDNEIAPLMSTLIHICQEHGIPMVASFCYAAEDGNECLCTTALVDNPRTPQKLIDAQNVIFAKPMFVAARITKGI